MYHRSCSKETNLWSQRIRNAWNQERERKRERKRTGSRGQVYRVSGQKTDFSVFEGVYRGNVRFNFYFSAVRRESRGSLLPFPVLCALLLRVRIDDRPRRYLRREKDFPFSFLFSPPFSFSFLFLFFPTEKNGKKTERVVNTGVVVQEAFNQRAWKILFTRTRTPHRTPLYVPIRFFTPAHAAPLHTGPTFHD